MLYLQILVNGLLLGGIYACIAAGFSLVWGVLNIINILHGSFIVLGSYIAWFAYEHFGLHPFVVAPFAGLVLFGVGYVVQRTLINRVVTAPVLVTLTLTFGLDLLLINAMLLAFTADYRKVNLSHPMGNLSLGEVVISLDRLIAMVLALLFVGALWWGLRTLRIGRAIVAVRMDREAAALMGVRVMQIYGITFGLGAVMAGAAGSLLSVIFPISPLAGIGYLGKAFVVCVLGGLGSIPGVVVGGLALGVIESFGSLLVGPEHALSISFVLLIVLLVVRPRGIMGRKGYE